jgi:hypothetical protein
MNSLRPDESLVLALCDGDPRAKAIVDGWKFNTPVILMTKEDLDELSERRHTTFNFQRQADYYLEVGL